MCEGMAQGRLPCFVSERVRCLEVHMATMRVFYNKWVASPSREMGDVEEADSDVEKRLAIRNTM